MTKRDDALIKLGFKPGDEPGESQIKKAFHQKALEFHPDKNPSAEAKTQFIAVKEAYDFLRQPRDVQEASDRPPVSSVPSTFMSPEEIVRTFFGSQGFNFNFQSATKTVQYQLYVKRVFKQKDRFNNKSKQVAELPEVFDSVLSFERKMATLFNNVVQLTIHNKNLVLPQNGAEIILTNLLKNNVLLKAEYPKALFNEEQTARLKAHLEKNNRSKAHLQRKQREIKLFLVGACLGVWLPLLTGVAVIGAGLNSFTIASVVLGALSGYSVIKIHQAYLKFAAKYYNSPEKILAVHSLSEQAALLTGLKVKNNSDYLKSFFIKATYRHPLAFAAGLFYRLECNRDQITCIRSSFSKNPLPPSGNFDTPDIEAPSRFYSPLKKSKQYKNNEGRQAPSTAYQKRNVPKR